MKKLGIVAIVLLSVVAVVSAIGYRLFTSGAGGFDDWVVHKVVDIAQLYLVPDVDFESFSYDRGDLTLRGVSLVAPDGTKVVDAGTLRVALAGVPSPKNGVVIERVEVEGATLHLIKSPDGGFKGLVPFVEGENIKKQDQVAEDMRLSKAFQIHHITLKDCTLVYDEGDGQPPMQLGGIGLDMDVQPDPQATGDRVYELKTNLDRAPVLAIDVNGKLDLDTLALQLDELTLKADLARQEAMDALPPRLQELLRKHEAAGRIELTANGDVDLASPMASSLSADVAIDGLRVAAGEYRLPIDSGTIKVDYSDRVATLPTAQLKVCQGVVDAGGSQVSLGSSAATAGIRWTVSGFHLRDLLRANTNDSDTPARIAGVVASSGTANVTSIEPLALEGSGDVSIRRGRLVNIPMVSELARAMNVLGKLTGKPKYHDKADATFTLNDTGVQVEKLEMETELLAARGKGDIGYDGSLNLLLNAGPLEKIQNAAGVIGDILGAVTDQVVKYQVKGEVGDPKISVHPLGLGT